MSKFMTISKWGPNLGIRIPGYLVANLNIMPGDQAEVNHEGNRIILLIHKAERAPKLKTKAEEFEEQLLKDLHDWGVPGY